LSDVTKDNIITELLNKSMNKILILFAGGTMAMEKDEKGVLKPSKSHDQILKEIPEIENIADIDSLFITDKDSTNIDVKVWNKIGQAIFEAYDDYDGFVVIHGTDTMAYTASALSFMLQNLGKPIIFTGSQLPLADKTRSEARSNLLHATHFACMELAEVCLFFGSNLHRGNRAHKASQFDFDAFRSYNFGDLGKAAIKAVLYEHTRKRKITQPVLNKFDEEKKIGLIKYSPGLTSEIITQFKDLGYNGLVIEGVGPGNLPTQKGFHKKIKESISSGIPVVITTQCELGSVELDAYEVGHNINQSGIINGKDMTTEAAITKLHWCISKYNDMSTIKEVVEEEIVGELT
jgi:L-asparaginase